MLKLIRSVVSKKEVFRLIIKLRYVTENIERELKITAKKNFLPMQMGDVPETLADTSLLHTLTDYRPSTSVKDGIKAFVTWYREYYDC